MGTIAFTANEGILLYTKRSGYCWVSLGVTCCDVTLCHGTSKSRYFRVLTDTTGLRSPNDLQILHRSRAFEY
eukprot:188529-Amorphochlora_amoeboformis.AAC.1